MANDTKCLDSLLLKITFICSATIIQGRKLLIIRTFLVRQVFKGDNYSREETIRGNTVITDLLKFFEKIIIRISYQNSYWNSLKNLIGETKTI